jgi:hypothetical protein
MIFYNNHIIVKMIMLILKLFWIIMIKMYIRKMDNLL